MLNDLFTWLNSLLSGNIWLVLTGSFIWGMLSVLLSPCHLSAIPLIVGYVTGNTGINISKSFKISVSFSIGILITIAVIGLITASLGRMIGDIGETGVYVLPFVFIIAGLYLAEIIKFDSWGINSANVKSKGSLKALSLGIILGIGLGPCTFAFMAPVLGAVFQISQINLALSIFVIGFFALGQCGVIAGAGTLSKYVQLYLNWNENSKALSIIKKFCGILVILAGIYLLIQLF